jgi:hypothetical protein
MNSKEDPLAVDVIDEKQWLLLTPKDQKKYENVPCWFPTGKEKECGKPTRFYRKISYVLWFFKSLPFCIVECPEHGNLRCK